MAATALLTEIAAIGQSLLLLGTELARPKWQRAGRLLANYGGKN
jgi:hypothetical protein